MKLTSLSLLFVLVSATVATAATHTLSAEEEKLFKIVKAHPEQERKTMKLDPILCQVARSRAADLARREYFAHVNPDGEGPNLLVRRAGFFLPSFYSKSKDANNIESIAARSPKGKAQDGFDQWLGSSFHRPHLLGLIDFNREQTFVGVGIFNSNDAPFATYYVFISAPKNRNQNPPSVTLKSHTGETIAKTRN